MRNYLIALSVLLSLCAFHVLSASAEGENPAKLADAPAIKVGGFALLASTDSGGHTIYRTTGSAKTVDEVIAALADPLAKIFDAKPVFSGGFADAKTKKTGGCTFTATLHGKPIKGAIFAGVNDTGIGSATVVYGPADISKDEMKVLTAAIPAKPKMTRHDFSDNSGSVDLPDGWTTKNQSLADMPLVITGPSGQTIMQGGRLLVNLPTGLLATQTKTLYQQKVQRFRSMQQMAARMGRPVPPGMDPGPPPDLNKDLPFVFCDFCQTPEEINEKLNPILKQKAQQRNVPWSEQTKNFATEPVTPQIGGSAFVVYNAGALHSGDKTTNTRSLQRMEIMPVDPNNGSWSIWINTMGGPDATFNQDVIVMMDIVNSIQVNADVVSQKIAARGAATSKMLHDQFEASQKLLSENHKAFEAQQQDEFDRNQAAIATQEKAVHDSSSDMIEFSLGVRDVYDSTTGKMGQVDLFNSHAITQGLNDAANAPSRFVEIPLRQER